MSTSHYGIHDSEQPETAMTSVPDWLVHGAWAMLDIDRVNASRLPLGAEIGQIPRALAGRRLIVEQLDPDHPALDGRCLVWVRRGEVEPILWPVPARVLKRWDGPKPRADPGHGYASSAVSADHID